MKSKRSREAPTARRDVDAFALVPATGQMYVDLCCRANDPMVDAVLNAVAGRIYRHLPVKARARRAPIGRPSF